MKALAYKVSQKVLRPAPLRNFSVNALKREQASIENLIRQARDANHAAFCAIDEERRNKVCTAARKAREDLRIKSLSDEQFAIVMDHALKDGPHPKYEHDYVVSKRLLDLLSLRLRLCRAELARKTFVKRTRKG